MDKLFIRPATEQDISIIHQLALEIWNKHYPSIITQQQIDYMLKMMYSTKALLQQMEEHHHFFIAFMSEKPLGYFSYSKQQGNNYMLHKLYIKTSEHHKGLGKQLLLHLINLLDKPAHLRLTVNRKNIQAINFYFRNGFILEEAKDFDIENGFFMKDFVMKLQL